MHNALKYLENNSFFENGIELVTFEQAVTAIKIALDEIASYAEKQQLENKQIKTSEPKYR